MPHPTTSDLRRRAEQAADMVSTGVRRLVDRVGSRGVDISIHIDRVIVSAGDDAMEARLTAALTDAKEIIMGVLDQLRSVQGDTRTLLGQAADIIAEIRVDLDDLLARLANSQPGSQEVMDATAEATEIKERLSAAVLALREAAGKHTPGTQQPGELTLTCPLAQTVTTEPGAATAAAFFDPPQAQGGTEPVQVSLSHESGSQFPVGETTVTANATDAAGKTASCQFTVTVVAGEATGGGEQQPPPPGARAPR